MVDYTKYHWVSGLCPSSSILNNWKTQRFGNWIFPSSGEVRETPTLLGPLVKASVNHRKIEVSSF
jgi:hypothetical protein